MTEPNTAIRDQRMTILESLNQFRPNQQLGVDIMRDGVLRDVINTQYRAMTAVPQRHYFERPNLNSQFQQPNLQPIVNFN